MPYKVVLGCTNPDCSYCETKNVLGATDKVVAVNMANELNRDRKARCPECGEPLLYCASTIDKK